MNTKRKRHSAKFKAKIALEAVWKLRMQARQDKAQRPERWSGSTRDWQAETIVYLNPNKSTQKKGVKDTDKAA